MDGVAMQIAIPAIGIVAAAAITFYAVSFNEIREKSFRNLDELENDTEFKSTMSSRERRALRKSGKKRP